MLNYVHGLTLVLLPNMNYYEKIYILKLFFYYNNSTSCSISVLILLENFKLLFDWAQFCLFSPLQWDWWVPSSFYLPKTKLSQGPLFSHIFPCTLHLWPLIDRCWVVGRGSLSRDERACGRGQLPMVQGLAASATSVSRWGAHVGGQKIMIGILRCVRGPDK